MYAQNSQQLLEVLEAIDTIQEPDQIIQSYCQYIAEFNFSSFTLGHMVNPVDVRGGDSFYVSNWPHEWQEHWINQDYLTHDPIASYALSSRQPFTWAQAYEHGTRFGKQILDEARNVNLSDGLAFPMTMPDRPPGIVSIGCEMVADFPVKDIKYLELASIHLYARLEDMAGSFPIRGNKHLTRREVDVLQYAAAGKTNWEISKILTISDSTARDYISSAMHKLDCVNRGHAIAKAIRHNIILA